MSRRLYLSCKQCNRLVLVGGVPQQGDFYECPHGLRQSRSNVPATVYYEDASGKRLYPWDGRNLPKTYTDLGYQRFEVGGFERSKFERDTRRQLNEEGQRKREAERAEYEEARSRSHAELRHESQSWNEFEREVAQIAMAEEDAGYSRSRYDSEFRIGE